VSEWRSGGGNVRVLAVFALAGCKMKRGKISFGVGNQRERKSVAK